MVVQASVATDRVRRQGLSRSVTLVTSIEAVVIIGAARVGRVGVWRASVWGTNPRTNEVSDNEMISFNITSNFGNLSTLAKRPATGCDWVESVRRIHTCVDI